MSAQHRGQARIPVRRLAASVAAGLLLGGAGIVIAETPPPAGPLLAPPDVPPRPSLPPVTVCYASAVQLQVCTTAEPVGGDAIARALGIRNPLKAGGRG